MEKKKKLIKKIKKSKRKNQNKNSQKYLQAILIRKKIVIKNKNHPIKIR